jgi:KaiC/GvpD/RAD55 family RecA-like ATPase
MKKEQEQKQRDPKKTHSIPEKVKSGIPNFNDLIEGGFEKNSINLVVGGSGAGKSIFAVHFLVEGIKNEENCLYITFEEKKKEFYTNMAEVGFDLETYEKQGKFYFLEYTPQKVRTMLEEGGGLIESLVLTKKIKRIVIDSITSFMLLFEKEIEQREGALTLFSLLRKWDCTSLLTYEGNPLEGKKNSGSRVVDFESDSITLLYFVRGPKSRRRYLEIQKMRGAKHSLSIHPYEITDDGIVVSKEVHEGKLPSLVE